MKPSRGLGRWLVRGSLRKDSEGKEKPKHCLENVGHLWQFPADYTLLKMASHWLLSMFDIQRRFCLSTFFFLPPLDWHNSVMRSQDILLKKKRLRAFCWFFSWVIYLFIDPERAWRWPKAVPSEVSAEAPTAISLENACGVMEAFWKLCMQDKSRANNTKWILQMN